MVLRPIRSARAPKPLAPNIVPNRLALKRKPSSLAGTAQIFFRAGATKAMDCVSNPSSMATAKHIAMTRIWNFPKFALFRASAKLMLEFLVIINLRFYSSTYPGLSDQKTSRSDASTISPSYFPENSSIRFSGEVPQNRTWYRMRSFGFALAASSANSWLEVWLARI